MKVVKVRTEMAPCAGFCSDEHNSTVTIPSPLRRLPLRRRVGTRGYGGRAAEPRAEAVRSVQNASGSGERSWAPFDVLS